LKLSHYQPELSLSATIHLLLKLVLKEKREKKKAIRLAALQKTILDAE